MFLYTRSSPVVNELDGQYDWRWCCLTALTFRLLCSYLLTDSRPRKMMLALPSALPLPFLSCLLDTLFASFQPPTISLMPIPILATVAAGLRSALVIDMGWAETVVTGVYEFREINLRRTVRAGKMLTLEMLKLLACGVRKEEYPEAVIGGVRTLHRREDEELVSRDECDEVVSRIAWCRPQANVGTGGEKEISIPLRSTSPPSTVQLPFSSLAEPAERALFATGIDSRELDDEELPLPTLIYQTLLQLPIDVRAVCMSRIIFVGETSLIPGLKSRIVNDLAALVSEKGWNPVRGKAFEQMMAKTRASARVAPRATDTGEESDHDRFEEARSDVPARDGESSRRGSNSKDATPEDSIRVVDSMGAWQGGSLLSQLKIPAVSTIEREAWLQHGILGASRVSDVVAPGKQRHSMGSGGLRSVIGNQSSWTLGTWA